MPPQDKSPSAKLGSYGGGLSPPTRSPFYGPKALCPGLGHRSRFIPVQVVYLLVKLINLNKQVKALTLSAIN